MEKLFSNNMELYYYYPRLYFIPSDRALVVLCIDDTPTQYIYIYYIVLTKRMLQHMPCIADR